MSEQCDVSVPPETLQTCIVIPVYNHEHAISGVVERLETHQLPCILVDDGSSAPCAQVLDELTARYGWVQLVRLPQNSGKGAAVMAGFREAFRLGYRHVLQIDADGQHDTDDIPLFLAQAKEHPNAIINGEPKYDESVPKSRFYARYLTHVWVWINTLSTTIGDSMCGFRLYPLAPTIELMNTTELGVRMDFDTEILVRLFWHGVPILPQPTAVHYPTDGVSHFDLCRDNVAISAMHARLFGGMLLRLPRLLARKFAL